MQKCVTLGDGAAFLHGAVADGDLRGRGLRAPGRGPGRAPGRGPGQRGRSQRQRRQQRRQRRASAASHVADHVSDCCLHCDARCAVRQHLYAIGLAALISKLIHVFVTG